METVSGAALARAGLAPHERFFVELWHQMVNMRSLDSYRAKCLNARTIVRELAEELRAGRMDDVELAGLCGESKEWLANDPIIGTKYQSNYEELKGYLADPPKVGKPDGSAGKKDEKETSARRMEAFRYCSIDFSLVLEDTYFSNLCEELPGAIQSTDEDKIKAIVDAVLSDLMDRGNAIERLCDWHLVFLPSPRREQRPFSENLSFMIRTVQKGNSKHRVTLRLEGTNKLLQIGKYGQFTFVTTPPSAAAGATGAFKRFYSPIRNTTFATCEVAAPDHNAAALEARKEIESLIDLMRLEYEEKPIRIDNRSHTVRLDDNKVYVVVTKPDVPNPQSILDDAAFLQFVERYNNLHASRLIEPTSLEQIGAAVRLYRLGRDTLRHQDKCLYWWMGLEALTYLGKGHIGTTVVFNASRILLHGYLRNLLDDFVATLQAFNIAWSDELKQASKCDSLDKLEVRGLIPLLQSPDRCGELWSKCADHPVVVYRGKSLASCLESPKKTLERLEQHLRHLEWQITRLYRIRCGIVHGSVPRFPLVSFASNSEYYLKKAILFVIDSLDRFKHVTSHRELFSRVAYSWDRAKQILDKSTTLSDVAWGVFTHPVGPSN
jgi:hypothetical protein